MVVSEEDDRKSSYDRAARSLYTGVGVDQRPELERRIDEVAPSVRRALLAWFGTELGEDAYSEAMLYAFSHPDKLRSVGHLGPYLVKVGRSKVRQRRLTAAPESAGQTRLPEIEPRLKEILLSLSGQQRASVVLIHGWQWSFSEVAELLGISKSAVQRHVDRALKRLRSELGVEQ